MLPVHLLLHAAVRTCLQLHIYYGHTGKTSLLHLMLFLHRTSFILDSPHILKHAFLYQTQSVPVCKSNLFFVPKMLVFPGVIGEIMPPPSPTQSPFSRQKRHTPTKLPDGQFPKFV